MRVDQTVLWILLALCSLTGAGYVLARERPRPDRPRAEQRVLTALTGVGAGMAVAGLVLFAAALAARL